MGKYYLQDFVIEVTRRCNAECEHCLRGDAEENDLDLFELDSFLVNVSGIGQLTLTGGEPSLAVDKIRGVLDLLKRHSISVDNFYIATNGINIPQDFLLVCVDLWLYCKDNEISRVEVSDNMFLDEYDRNYDILEALSFFGKRSRLNLSRDTQYIVNEGHGSNWGTKNATAEDLIVDPNNRIETMVYFSVHGDICLGCDFSYDTIDTDNFCDHKVFFEKAEEIKMKNDEDL